jgi:hypothetical protein
MALPIGERGAKGSRDLNLPAISAPDPFLARVQLLGVTVSDSGQVLTVR